MDASASHKVDAEINDVYAFFFNVEDTEFPTPYKQRNTVIKYTKLPDFDFVSKGSCRQKSSLEPRLRRLITLEEPPVTSSRSLKLTEPIVCSKSINLNKRKIITISEDEEYNLHPKFSKDSRKSSALPSSRSVGVEPKKELKLTSQRTTSRLTKPTTYLKDAKTGAKKKSSYDRNNVDQSTCKSKILNNDPGPPSSTRARNPRDRDIPRKTKSVALSRTSVSKNCVTPSEHELLRIKSKLYDNSKSYTTKKSNEKIKISKPHNVMTGKSKESQHSLVRTTGPNVLPVILVPLEKKYGTQKVKPDIPSNSVEPEDTENIHNNTTSETCLPKTTDQMTDMEGMEPEIIYKCVASADVQTNVVHEMFDKLEIPNVSLKRERSEPSLKSESSEAREALSDLHTQYFQNLEIPTVSISDNRHKNESIQDSQYCNSMSYVISRATLTYRSKQKINFQVVGSNDDSYSNQPPSPLKYPLNVVSIFKKELTSKEMDVKNDNSTLRVDINERESSKECKNCINEIKSHDCSYVPNSNKLMKPSDIISTIRVSNSLLQSVYLCEQFQRELNFIDSFFESLQYLEKCAHSEKCIKNDKIERIVNNTASSEPEFAAKKSELDSFLSTLDNGTNSDDSETMASKNLFLLNILIRDEQRRAKNLLCVLKRREDALKDFTKSQILYLENKKKQENTDITVLKKKQRGALLKLQHECGEMQRMRKALLVLSEKRKLALMKTKKDLELKLKNNVDVKQIILGKKKLKRNPTLDRSSIPLKCFDLSSSGCEDSTSSQYTSEGAVPTSAAHASPTAPAVVEPVKCVEKSIQTTDCILESTSTDQSGDAAAENFIAVDGGYLNIIFHNLSLPQIFSGGKSYEVNEEALKSIVESSNTVYSDNWDEFMEKLLEQGKNDDDKSSTPSTARSLVEEFEQYYKTLAEEDELEQRTSGSSKELVVTGTVSENSNGIVQDFQDSQEPQDGQNSQDFQDSHNFQDSQYFQNSQDFQDSQDFQNSHAFQDSQNLQDFQNSQDFQDPPDSQDFQNSHEFQDSQNSQAVQDVSEKINPCESQNKQCEETVTEIVEAYEDSFVSTVDETCNCELLLPDTDSEPLTGIPGPLPVPAGASDVSSNTTFSEGSASSQPPYELASSVSSLIEPAHEEAEELRRQQLAIEKEIKELEQQQSRLLVVREIPDKPPPPYTPPAEARSPKQPQRFRPDGVSVDKIRKYITENVTPQYDPTDGFEVLLQDFCLETQERLKTETSDKPWEPCNVLPPKKPVEPEEVIESASADLVDVLTVVTPSIMSSVSSRRSDHIDDILFTEWRHVEPEWTSLQTDEVLVKNQIFETIFQQILTKTIDEYKRTVLSPVPD